MTLSEDEVDFRIFRVMSKKLKSQLGDKALEWKTMILDATYHFCTESVANVFKIYNDMEEKIRHDPINEKELIASKEFIATAPAKVEQLTEELKEVYRHYIMLEKFSYMYKELDIESFWYMKVWPLKIQACLTDGKNMAQDKNDLFSAKLEAEKESFTKQIVQYTQTFEKIKEF
jgi:YHS domain-containing protein